MPVVPPAASPAGISSVAASGGGPGMVLVSPAQQALEAPSLGVEVAHQLPVQPHHADPRDAAPPPLCLGGWGLRIQEPLLDYEGFGCRA